MKPMKTSALVCFVFVFVLVVMIRNLIAQIPYTMKYQGKLTDSSGVGINDTLRMRFELYDVEAEGEPLWTESHSRDNTIPVIKGLFDVILGSINPIVLPFNELYWLSIEVDGDTLTPREPLYAVPYAFRAVIADSLSGEREFYTVHKAHEGAAVDSGNFILGFDQFGYVYRVSGGVAARWLIDVEPPEYPIGATLKLVEANFKCYSSSSSIQYWGGRLYSFNFDSSTAAPIAYSTFFDNNASSTGYFTSSWEGELDIPRDTGVRLEWGSAILGANKRFYSVRCKWRLEY